MNFLACEVFLVLVSFVSLYNQRIIGHRAVPPYIAKIAIQNVILQFPTDLDIREIGPHFKEQYPKECLRGKAGSNFIGVIKVFNRLRNKGKVHLFLDLHEGVVLRDHLREYLQVEKVPLIVVAPKDWRLPPCSFIYG